MDFDPKAEFRMATYIEHCMETNRAQFLLVIILGALALFTTVTLAYLHGQRLNERPLCVLRGYYHSIFIFPVVWAFTSFLTLLCPLSAPLAELFQGQSEAYGIYVFLVILYMLVSIEACQKGVEEGGDLRSPVMNMGETIVQALHDEGPQRYFAVPPCGCCLWFCYRPHHLSACQLLCVSRLVKQYVLAQIFLSTFFLWGASTFTPEKAERLNRIARWVLKASGLLAIYGLMTLYKATHGLLHHWHTTRKFLAIKFVIFLSILQGKIFAWCIHAFHRGEHTCLVDPARPEDLEHVIIFWTQFATLLETILMVYLMARAFTPEEVSDYPLKNLDLVELELRQLHASEEGSTARNGSFSSSDEEVDES